MTTNYFSTLEIPEELQLKLTELVTATPYSFSSGVWTPDAVQSSGGVPDILQASEQSYFVDSGGIVNTLVSISSLSFAGCAAFGVSVTNFPLWDRDADILASQLGYVSSGSPMALSPISASLVGAGTKTVVYNFPALGAAQPATLTALYRYPAAA